jgi:hypothetical protein
MIIDRVQALKRRHARLEAEIARESVRPAADEWTLNALKREKLRLKDLIEALDRGSRAAAV